MVSSPLTRKVMDVAKCPFCGAESPSNYGTRCPQCGKAQGVTALFLNLRKKEEQRFFSATRVSWLVRLAVATGAILVVGTAVWVLLR